MEITNVQIRVLEQKNKLKAVATITIDNVFVVHELKILEGSNGLFVGMPSKETPNGFKDIAHPIDKKTREIIEQKVIEKYLDETSK